MDFELEAVRKKYRNWLAKTHVDSEEYLKDMHTKYRDRIMNAVDAMSVACSVADFAHGDSVHISELTPQMKEAFHLQYPTVSLDHLAHLTPEQLQGYVNGWTGKLFEVAVRDNLNSGEWVGNIHLIPGQSAVLAGNPTQAGWDLQILNPDGSVAQFLQMKATDSLSYIKAALERYPDFHIVATSDVFNNGDHISDALMHHITNSGISDDQLRSAVEHVVNHHPDLSAHLEELVPGLPFVVVGLTESLSLVRKKKGIREVTRDTLDRSVKSSVIMGIVHVLELSGAGTPITVPVAFCTRLGMSRMTVFRNLSRILHKRNSRLKDWKGAIDLSVKGSM
ncbi:hypothetical protein [Alicyclobacillus sp. SO9]|uniref:hypothetical protein n=1 Tax=Alicyclobacillus sp. SO9 TaxID=2665646 RepID=UPI0018E71115|nr:hypothetical protein [Alicyclobacillus sp. SO9]QQE80428.1 hypothetical protein GI364_08445 [Alicyclobacillus sp. SO9]